MSNESGKKMSRPPLEGKKLGQQTFRKTGPTGEKNGRTDVSKKGPRLENGFGVRMGGTPQKFYKTLGNILGSTAYWLTQTPPHFGSRMIQKQIRVFRLLVFGSSPMTCPIFRSSHRIWPRRLPTLSHGFCRVTPCFRTWTGCPSCNCMQEFHF